MTPIYYGGNLYEFVHAQFVHCGSAVNLNADCLLRNVLMSDVETAFDGAFSLSVEHGTFDRVGQLNVMNSLQLTNCLLVAVTNTGSYSGSNNASNSDPAAVFSTVGAGAHYLSGNQYRNIGTTNLTPSLARDLLERSTFPPTVMTYSNIATNLTLSIQAPRCTNLPDLGWHYGSLDWVFGSNSLSNATLRIPAGVVLGTFTPGSNTHGLLLLDGARVIVSADPTNLARIVRYNTVQEQESSAWSSQYPGAQIRTSPQSAAPPSGDFRFTDWSVPALEPWHFDGQTTNFTAFVFRDCQFAGGKIRSSAVQVAFTNCLFSRVNGYSEDRSSTNVYVSVVNRWYNNTFYGGAFTFNNNSNGHWEIYNNAFYNTADLSSDSGVLHGWNAYLPGAPLVSGWLSNGIVTNIVFVSGPGSDFYLTNGSPLLNRGKTNADLYGFFWYTTAVDQQLETNSTVDIGFHRVALASTNVGAAALDTDADGFANWIEDINGNGTHEAGEGDTTLPENPFYPRYEPLGPSSRRTPLVISEIMYAPASGSAFIEIYNSSYLTLDLKGFRLGGGISYTWSNSTALSAGGFLTVTNGQWSGTLNRVFGKVQLLNRQGAILLEVNYRSDWPWPEEAGGAGHSIVLARPSYGEDDPRAWSRSERIGGSPGAAETILPDLLRNVRINEFLVNPTNSQTAFVELYNRGLYFVEISGAFLSTNVSQPKMFSVPTPTVIPPGGWVSFNYGTNAGQLPFARGSNGGAIYFTHPDGNRVLDAVTFPNQVDGVSMGRAPNGASGLRELITVTPGASNSAPIRRDIVISEIMFNPISGDSDDEYVEFANRGTIAIDVDHWLLHGVGTSNDAFDIGNFSDVPPGGSVIVCKKKGHLNDNYPGPQITDTNAGGNYPEKLSNGGQRLMLFNRASNLISEVYYRDGGRWGKWADGGGSSLELMDLRANERVAYNWGDSDESSKSLWITKTTTGVTLSLGDPNAANTLELGLLDAGECLVDDVFLTLTNGSNLVSNGSFASGLTSWGFEGSHDQSTLMTNGGPDGSACLHLRAVGQVEYLHNRVTNMLSSAVATNATVTNSFKMRWLHGNPELLVRLRGNSYESVGNLFVPANLGTPALANSRAVSNVGPAVYEVEHYPPVPAANRPVVVTARVDDPDGIASAVLWYRIDPTNTFTNVTLRDDGLLGDAVAGDGLFSAIIPAQSSGKLVAFCIEAADGATPSLTNRFPSDAPARECLVRFGDTMLSGSFPVYRFWITKTNIDVWSAHSPIDSTPRDLTFVYGTNRVIYNCGGAFSGSDFHAPYFDSPTNNLCGYNLDIPSDDRFLGSSGLALNGALRDNTGQTEIIANWLADHVGLPNSYRQYIQLVADGITTSQRPNTIGVGANSGVKVLTDAQSPGGDFLSEWYDGRDSGDLYKLTEWYPTYKLPVGGLNGQDARLRVATNSSGLKNGPSYRWNWRKRAAGSANNNYTNLFALVDGVNTNGANYITSVTNVVDVEEWGGILGLERAVGNYDSYGYQPGQGQNMFAYRPDKAPNQRWQLLAYDLEISFGVDGSVAPTNSVFNGFSDPIIQTLWTTNAFRRAYWRGFWSLVNETNGPLHPSRVLPIADANYQALIGNSLTVSNSAQTNFTNWIGLRFNSLTNQLAPVRPPFQLLSADGSTTNSTFDLSGYAPIEVVWLRTNYQTFPTNPMPLGVTWLNETQWTATVGLSVGTNTFVIEGFDRNQVKLSPYGSETYTKTNTIVRNP